MHLKHSNPADESAENNEKLKEQKQSAEKADDGGVRHALETIEKTERAKLVEEDAAAMQEEDTEAEQKLDASVNEQDEVEPTGTQKDQIERSSETRYPEQQTQKHETVVARERNAVLERAAKIIDNDDWQEVKTKLEDVLKAKYGENALEQLFEEHAFHVLHGDTSKMEGMRDIFKDAFPGKEDAILKSLTDSETRSAYITMWVHRRLQHLINLDRQNDTNFYEQAMDILSGRSVPTGGAKKTLNARLVDFEAKIREAEAQEDIVDTADGMHVNPEERRVLFTAALKVPKAQRMDDQFRRLHAQLQEMRDSTSDSVDWLVAKYQQLPQEGQALFFAALQQQGQKAAETIFEMRNAKDALQYHDGVITAKIDAETIIEIKKGDGIYKNNERMAALNA